MSQQELQKCIDSFRKEPVDTLNGLLDDEVVAQLFVAMWTEHRREFLRSSKDELVRLRFLGVSGFLLVSAPGHPLVSHFVRGLLDYPKQLGLPFVSSWVLDRAVAQRIASLMARPNKTSVLKSFEAAAASGQPEALGLLSLIEQQGRYWERTRARISRQKAQAAINKRKQEKAASAGEGGACDYPDLIPIGDFRTEGGAQD